MIHKFYLNGLYIVLDVNSGTLLTVDEMTYDLLEDFQDLDAEKIVQKYSFKYDPQDIREGLEEIQELVDEQILFTKNEYDPGFYKNNNLIKAMCLHVAHDCNLKCYYCFASQGDFKGGKCLMSLDVGKKAIDFLIENSKGRYNLEIDFFGGEPLMNLTVIKELVAYARSKEKQYRKKFNFTTTTNGTLLSDKNIQWLHENMDNVVLSIDGRKAIHDKMRPMNNNKGSYDLIIEDVKKMAALRDRDQKDYYIRGTFTKFNRDFGEDVKFLAHEGFKQISVEPVVAEEKYDYAILEEDLPELLAEYDHLALDYLERKKQGLDYNFFHFNVDLGGGPCVFKRLSGCGAGRDYVAVTPEGDVFPCHQFVGTDEFKLGTIYDGIQNKEITKEFEGANLLEKNDCKQCWCRFICGGGCHANAYNFNHSVLKPYHVACELEKRRVENALMISVLEDAQ